jgi:hypothetical protein
MPANRPIMVQAGPLCNLIGAAEMIGGTGDSVI